MTQKTNLPVIEMGEGKPLIFLHGFGCSKEFFIPQLNYFSRYFKVVAYDLYGFGENIPKQVYDLADYVEEFKRIALQYGSSVSVVAHSFGCRIALKCMAEYDIIDKAVLCGVAGLKPAFSVKKSIKRGVYKIVKPFFNRQKLEKYFFSADYNSLNELMKQTFKLVINENLDNSLSQIKAPVLAIFGERDDQTPPNLIKRLEGGIANCNSYVMRNCGHFCFAERPNEFNNVSKEFLI